MEKRQRVSIRCFFVKTSSNFFEIKNERLVYFVSYSKGMKRRSSLKEKH